MCALSLMCVGAGEKPVAELRLPSAFALRGNRRLMLKDRAVGTVTAIALLHNDQRCHVPQVALYAGLKSAVGCAVDVPNDQICINLGSLPCGDPWRVAE